MDEKLKKLAFGVTRQTEAEIEKALALLDEPSVMTPALQKRLRIVRDKSKFGDVEVVYLDEKRLVTFGPIRFETHVTGAGVIVKATRTSVTHDWSKEREV